MSTENLSREIAISLNLAAAARVKATAYATRKYTPEAPAKLIDQAFDWVGEARRLRMIREQDERDFAIVSDVNSVFHPMHY